MRKKSNTGSKDHRTNNMGMNGLTLEFREKNVENDFLQYYGIHSLRHIRLYFLLGIFIFSLFGLHDYLLIDEKPFILLVRFGIVLPGLILLIVLTYLTPSPRNIERMLCIAMILCGIGTMIIKGYSGEAATATNYTGVGLTIIFIYTLLPMTFSYALLAGIVLTIVWTLFVTVIQPLPYNMLVSNMFYVYTSLVLGIFAGRVKEFNARKAFYHMIQTKEEQQKILIINSELEKNVADRTEILDLVNKRLHEEIQEKMRTEKELVLAKQHAENSDRMKSAFLANMSHEIRTPMNGILGFAQLLSSPNINEEKKRKFITIINDNGKLLLKIVDDILDFAKIEACQLKIEKANCNIDEMLTRLLATYNVNKVFRRKNHIDLRLVCESETKPKIIYTDGKRLEQVLSNLLDNALKFTDEGYIEFGYREISPNLLTFHVKDTGIGISEKFENLIFERFNQAEIATKKYGGSGLGLAISKGIIELLGGKIGLNSESGGGANFSFTIPVHIHQQTNVEERSVDEKKQGYAWENKLLLVAEDEEMNFNLVLEILRESGINILHAKNGREVLEIYHQKKEEIDLILMDIKMPEMNGYDAIEMIRKENAYIPIIAHTAYAMTDERERCLQLGCNDYISKPIDADDFLNRLSKFLN